MHTAFLVFAAMLIAWFQQLLKFGYLLGRGVSIVDLLKLSMLVMPKILFIALPVIIALGVLMAYYDFFEQRVLVIYRAIGMGNWNLARPALQFTLMALIFVYGISLYVLPASSRIFRENLSYFKENFFFSVLNEKTFTPIAGSVVLYLGAKHEGNIVENVIIFDHRDKSNQSIILAEYGKLSIENMTPQFHLRKGVRLGYDQNINLNDSKAKDNSTLFFNELDIGFQLGSTKNKSRSRDVEEYHIYELLNPDSSLGLKKQHKLRIEGHKRIVWPIYSIVLCSLLLGVFLQFRDNRLGIGVKQWTSIAIMVILPCYFYFASLSFISKHPPYLWVMYLLPIIWLMLASFLFKRIKL